MVTALIVLGVALILGIVIAIFWWYVKFYFCALLYFICIAIFTIMDFFQDLFLIFAGLEPTGASGAAATQDGDMLQWFMTQESVRNAFLGLLALAMVLLVIFTVIQIIRVEYTTEGAQNAKGNVLKNAFKALTMFAIVPAFCAMGVIAGNALLKAINSATGGDTRVTLSAKLFLLGANDGDPKKQKDKDDEYYKFVPGVPMGDLFMAKLKGEADNLAAWYENAALNPKDWGGTKPLMANPNDPVADIIGEKQGTGESKATMQYGHKDFDTVVFHYDITKIGWGYIIIFLLGPLFISALYSAMVGMIMRIYMAVILYVISPPIVAMYVLDEGSAYKNWRQRFIGTVLSGYGTVVAFNLYMMIAEVVSGSGMLNFFESDFLNRAVELIFLLVGAMMLKNISKTISGIIGADDAMEQGEGIGKQITDKAKKVGKTAVGVGVGAATLAVGGAAMLGSAGAGIASKVAAWKGGKNADKLDKANEGLSEKQKAVRSRSTNVQKMMDKKQNDLAQKIYKKDFSELKEDQQKEIMENLGKNKAYNRYAEMKANLDNEAEDLGSQMAANTAEKEKELTRGRTAHVIAARTAKLGGANFKGMFANSSVGKSFNQITGNAIKATGGKGINQWDGEITQYSDTEGDIFKEYNKANEATKEKLYNKYVLGARGTNFARSNIAPQTREEAQKEYENIMMAGQESGAQEQGLRINQRDIADGIIRGFREGAFASAKDLDQMRDNAKEHERLTGSNAMTLQVAKLEGINAQFQRGEISAADAERKARKVEHDMHLDQKVDTKVEAEIKKDGGDFQKLKDAIKAGNHEAMDKALKSLQEKLGKEGVQIKDIEQITKEIQKLATEEKANEKKLTKIMSQIGKLTGK